jgi:SAM-dependent methyltransferase
VFDYWKCGACNLVFLDPIPGNLGRYYQSDYYAVPQDLSELKTRASAQRHKIDLLQSLKPAGRVLEIGPSFGDFVCLAQQAGYQVSAVEMDPTCCEFLASTLKIPVSQSTEPVATLAELGMFDAIVMWQVIEHLENPWRMIAVAAEHLAPGGVLVLTTPNPESLQFGLFGKLWAHVEAPRHLRLIPRALMVRWAERAGLSLTHASAGDGETRKSDVFGWKKSLMNFVGVSVLESAPEVAAGTTVLRPTESPGYRFKRGIMRGAVAAIRLVAAPLERTGWRGSSYTLAFRRPPA